MWKSPGLPPVPVGAPVRNTPQSARPKEDAA